MSGQQIFQPLFSNRNATKIFREKHPWRQTRKKIFDNRDYNYNTTYYAEKIQKRKLLTGNGSSSCLLLVFTTESRNVVVSFEKNSFNEKKAGKYSVDFWILQ